MKKKIFILFSLLLSLFTFVSCGDSKNNTEPSVKVSDLYTYDNTDTTKLAVEKTKTVRIHYYRTDNNGNYENYDKWKIWCWDCTNNLGGAWYSFDKYDDFGVWMDIDIKTVSSGKETAKLGFLVATKNWTKDGDNDRYIDILDTTPGGIQNIYLRQGQLKVYTDIKSAMDNSVKYARMVDKRTIRVIFNVNKEGFVAQKGDFKIYKNNVEINNLTIADYEKSANATNINLQSDIDISDIYEIEYKFNDKSIDRVGLLITNYFDDQDFVSKYVYTGNDLGVSFDNVKNSTKTIFKLWAPTSQKVQLNIYKTGNYETDKTPEKTYNMVKGDKGVWKFEVCEDLSNVKYYTYTVTNARGTNEVVDPYAKSAGLNGKRGMVVNFWKLNKRIEGWNLDTIPNYGTLTDAIVYEIHVRDMTINPNSGIPEQYRGKFLGLALGGSTFTKNNVTVSTGLDHLKELGITHVQIQPFYDYSSVDESNNTKEMSKTNYNWGYDPLNYNCLEGSYSTNPADGLVRIVEFKKMVMALHENGIGINMDVVYNHTSSLDNSNFELIVPYYYHRFERNGQAYNGSGCGNEMASERAMVRKFIKESCDFWLSEYHLSGFRFDLMGLLDNQTMIDIYNSAKEIYPNVMVYGEPWTGGTSKLKDAINPNNLNNQQTKQGSLAQSYFAGNNVLVGAFNDVIRNAVRGDNGPTIGYVQGDSINSNTILDGIKGTFRSSESSINPGQVLNYVSCHDNYTLYDQLIQTKGTRDLNNMYSQAEFIVFTSQGVAFMQEGEDFMRSKNYVDESGATKYEGNSYNVGDFINDMDYSLKVDNIEMFNFFKKLVELRKNHNIFTLATKEEISSAIKQISATNGNIICKLENDDESLIVIHSLNGMTYNLSSEYEVLLANYETENTLSGEITLAANSSIVLKKK